MGGMSMRDVCQMHDAVCDIVILMCRRVGLAPPPPPDILEEEVLHILTDVHTPEQSRAMAVKMGIVNNRVLDILCGVDKAVPLGYEDRCDLHPSRVCMLHQGTDDGLAHPELRRRIRDGRVRECITSKLFRLVEHPALWLSVIDTLNRRGCWGALASRDVIEEISEACGVSYLCVWLVAQELGEHPGNTIRWGGERAKRLEVPEFVPISVALPWERLHGWERSAMVERHGLWHDDYMWLPVEEWYRLGLHGLIGSLRYPSPKLLPTFKDAKEVPKLSGRRADSLGRLWSRRATLSKRRRGRVGGLRVERMVYEAWNEYILHPRAVVSFMNGDRRDCRPENLFCGFGI